MDRDIGAHVSGDSRDGLDFGVVDDVADSGEVADVGAEREIGTVAVTEAAGEVEKLGLDFTFERSLKLW